MDFTKAKLFVAPMVEQSELAWRLLSRKYNAQVTYTPMFHAKLFSTSEKYRLDNFHTKEGDEPLIVQFCANSPTDFVNAAKLVQDRCVAVDLNLGCPQHIAKRGHYGSYLQDEWPLISSIVKLAVQELKIPVTVKIRVFNDVKKTIKYAKMIEEAGAALLTVHGRQRHQKGHLTGLADWNQIKAVKQAINIPVIANGNILYFEDIEKCIKETGCDGVMTAEGNLYNPAIFTNKIYASWYFAEGYMSIVNRVPNSAKTNQVKAHLFKLFHKCLPTYTDLREKLGTSNSMEQLKEVVEEIKSRLIVWLIYKGKIRRFHRIYW